MKIVTKLVNNLLIEYRHLKIRLSRRVVIKVESKMTPKQAIGGIVMSKTTPSVTLNTPTPVVTVNRDY
ncbi:MAG: hypothetical protein MN733_05675 [Nitrososphaera sp.]|nr:hypothetical protein [Nitrososphaera sp.]